MNFSAIGASWQLRHFSLSRRPCRACKPITLIGPYAAGGTVDVLARTIQEPLRKALGQPIIVEVKPGASGLIATRYVARAPADGYTLLVQTNALVDCNNEMQSAHPLPLRDTAAVGVLRNRSLQSTSGL